MTRPTDVKQYPPQFMELADRFEKDPELEIPIETESAKALQLELLAFRRALRATDADKYPHFNQCEIRIGQDRKSVVVVSKSRTVSALAIERALSSIQPGE